MDSRIRVIFLALVVTQIAHSVEEYVFRFYEVFPPARFLNDLVAGLTRPGFIIVNTLLALFGLWCFFANVRPGSKSARDWVWIWVVIELFNGLAHPLWAIATRGYVPGLATSPVLFGLAACLFHRLRATHDPLGAGVGRLTRRCSGHRTAGSPWFVVQSGGGRLGLCANAQRGAAQLSAQSAGGREEVSATNGASDDSRTRRVPELPHGCGCHR
jgi:hypothetical protein